MESLHLISSLFSLSQLLQYVLLQLFSYLSKSAKINGVEGLAESVLMCMCRDGSCDTNGGPCRDYD